jgi:transposase-like protein
VFATTTAKSTTPKAKPAAVQVANIGMERSVPARTAKFGMENSA